MLNKILVILVLATLTFSCKKEDVMVDREETLELDTASYLYSVNYVSHVGADLTVDVRIASFDGLDRITSFSNYEYVDSTYDLGMSIDFSNISATNVSPISNYSTLVLMDLNETDSYNQAHLTAYLRRFFELADSLGNRGVGFGWFASEQNTGLELLYENAGQLFGNSWEFNNIEMNKKLSGEDFSVAQNVPGSYIKGRLIEAVDAVANASDASGDLSVTWYVGYSSYNLDQQDVDDVIAHAIANSVKINAIGLFQPDAQRIALESGGFVAASWFDYDNYPKTGKGEFNAVSTATMNLDDLLRGNVTTHNCQMVITQVGPGWNSGDEYYLRFNYSGYYMQFNVKIP